MPAPPLPINPTSAQVIQTFLMTTGMTQRALGELLGYDRRTIVRWVSSGTTLIPSHCAKLAAACHPRDRRLAAYFAQRGGTTLVALGLEAPAPAPAAARSGPSPRHLVDSVVCSAAEAMQVTPQAMRPGVVAAFERACALGMSAQDVLAALAPAPVAAAGKKGRTGDAGS